ncbi:MAG: ATP-dependent DNA helicase RecG [Planctomycetota bacterium]|nr:ATP-dependent DNA helicase RecG [Planctomycetota bacterium]
MVGSTSDSSAPHPRDIAGQGAANDVLQAPLQSLRGIGPALSRRLERIGLSTLGDLLHHFPSRHEDLVLHGSIKDVPDGERRSIYGSVEQAPNWISSGRGRWEAVLIPADEPHLQVTLQWYHSRRFRPSIGPGWHGWMTGPIRRFRTPVMAHPSVARSDQRDPMPPGHGQIVAIYPATEGVSQDLIRRAMQQILEHPDLDLDDELPAIIGSSRNLLGIYSGIHRPASVAECQLCSRLLARIELYLHAIRQARTRAARQARRVEPIVVSPEVEERILARFPYTLTDAQTRVIDEIRGDLAAGFPMARLVQGDVGSGKTALAIWALLAVVASGRQGALIAPTTALAEQHRETLRRYLSGSRVEVALVIAGSSAQQRRAVAEGDASIVVGTHALLAQTTEFSDLALVVIDEEQRFGVQQRQEMAKKGEDVHRLHLSATPIPRSLALAIRGDFDLSRVDQRPPGRPPVRTRWVDSEKFEDAINFLMQEIEAGNRVLFVVPRIEDGDGDDPVGVEQLQQRLNQTALAASGIGSLHGRLSMEERESRMNRFRSGRTPVLVATSIVEVGLDVPELTVMWIEGAERFGLAQLHQLRGRVGRSERPSWCFFTAAQTTAESRNRLQAFVEEDDGFQLAERDLKLRGGGDAEGARQSGPGGFRIADLLEDLPSFLELSRAATVQLQQKEDCPEGRALARLGPYLGPRREPEVATGNATDPLPEQSPGLQSSDGAAGPDRDLSR